ncbi:MAG: restriction endonuclease subunit S [Candidatus Dadabacteria bacterium]|nr:restriction endonuclease subunit S [Candidatus Dadabacteria bacterium]
MEERRGIVLVDQSLHIKEFTPIPLQSMSVSIQEIVENGLRLEASLYSTKHGQVRRDLQKCKWDIVPLENFFILTPFYLERFKRVYVSQGDGIPLILPSQITEICPKANKFISSETDFDIETAKVKRGQILLTRSGTVGVVAFVSDTLDGKYLSDDVIRIEAQYPGYIYTYLKSKMGRLLVETNNYGAVISHIEPEHLKNIPVPNPPPTIKRRIHNLIEESFKLRDESNKLMDEAQHLLKNELKLPDIEKIQYKAKQFDQTAGVMNYSVPNSELSNRFDGSYHIPIVREIERHITKNAKEVTQIGDERISQSVILPGRFKRVYVEEGRGVVFFGGKQIFELDPSNKKYPCFNNYLSVIHHADRITNQLTLNENMTLITCSGTIGKVCIVPKHWEGWTANQHIIRVVPADRSIAGYLHAWLSSDYSYHLITRFTYGAVVDEIDDEHVLQVSIPLLKNNKVQVEINELVLSANEKRTRAYLLEQKALKILDEKVVYARD